MPNDLDLKITTGIWDDVPAAQAPDSSVPNPPPIPEAIRKPKLLSHRLRGRFTLPVKTTMILVVLLVGAIAVCGAVFIKCAQKMLVENKTAQLNQLAYGLAAAFGDNNDHQAQMSSLKQNPNLDFAVLTDLQMKPTAAYIGMPEGWKAYSSILAGGEQAVTRHVGQVRQMPLGPKICYVVTVPVFRITPKGPTSNIIGYLHVASGDEGILAQLRFLEASVLLTCMGVVLLIVPLAGFVARHLTVPIQRLADAAHTLAEGDLTHRVLMRRSDELGELALAFNRMANTVEQQQEDIKEINSGLEEKVEERTAELQHVNHKLTAEITEKEDFLRAVSHDLNAPLRNIAGMTSMLIMKYGATLEKDALQRLERIQKNVTVQTELINELLELSRIKTRREKIERVDLHDLITGVADAFTSDFETKRIAFSVNGRLPVMKAEKARLRQVFQNLVDNAIKYMREDGPRTITVNTRWEPQELVISVRDTGMGIASDEIPHLFHVFRRAKNAAIMKIPGKGVGLASVKSIIENYHGRLWAESQLGEGTTFLIAIPRVHFEFAKQEVA